MTKNRIKSGRFATVPTSLAHGETSRATAPHVSLLFLADGRLFVRPDQPNLMDFMDNHPDNVANGGKTFELVNNEKKSKIKVQKEFLVADAVTMVRDKDLNDLLASGRGLGYQCR